MLNPKLIIDSGSNANGNYIKFSDGTMICHNHLEVPGGEWTSMSGGGYNLTKRNVATFPQPFIDNNISVNVSVAYDSQGGIYAIIGQFIRNRTGIESINLYRFAGANSAYGIKIDYIAIGKWK